MQTAFQPHLAAPERPAPLDLAAAGLLIATVVLHVVAMVPAYFIGSPSGSALTSSPDQAALYSVLAASWALALVIGVTGPQRTPMAAALAVGVAVSELGFRVADLGDALKYGTASVGAGLWLMESAWVVGAAAAVLAVLAAHHRHRSPTDVTTGGLRGPGTAGSTAPADVPDWQIDWAAPAAPAAGSEPQAGDPATAADTDAVVPDPGVPAGDVGAATEDILATPAPEPEPTATLRHVEDDPHERAAWTMLVVILALLVAGAFLPAWDRAVAYSTQSGRGITRNLGNAFSGPWQQVVGTVLAAVAMAVVPIVAVRLRRRAVGAAAVCGMLLVLATQLVAAVVQVDQPLAPAQIGLTPDQAGRLGLELGLKLTGWFTVDALAAYALFAAVMVWATLKVHHENSTGTSPSAPEAARDAIPWAS